MLVLKAYQADLLRDLDQGQGLSSDTVAELCRNTDLALRATKQTTAAIGRLMAAMVATERHLWVSLASIGGERKGLSRGGGREIQIGEGALGCFQILYTAPDWGPRLGQRTEDVARGTALPLVHLLHLGVGH